MLSHYQSQDILGASIYQMSPLCYTNPEKPQKVIKPQATFPSSLGPLFTLQSLETAGTKLSLQIQRHKQAGATERLKWIPAF